MAIEDNTLYGLTGAQIKELPGKIEAVKGLAKVLTTDDYNYPTTGTKTAVALWLLEPGLYRSDGTADVRWTSVSSAHQTSASPLYLVSAESYSERHVIRINTSDSFIYVVDPSTGNQRNRYDLITSIIDNLTSTSNGSALSANQGKVLKDLVDGLVISGTSAPTTSTVGTKGKLYEDTTNGKLYQCTNVSGSTYTWTEITKTSIRSATGRGQTGGLITEDLSSLSLAGKPESGLPYALMTSSGGGQNDWSYIRGIQDNSTGISSAYVGSYAYDWQEDWWSGKHESRLAMYSDLDGRVKQNAGAPTTSTVGTKGQLLEDTTNGKVYICTAINGNTYTWEEVGSGGGSSVTKTSDLTNDGSDGTSTYVEADELASVATSGSYSDLSNKPTIPTVNDSTITITNNGTTVDSFTTNASSNKTIALSSPVITMTTTDPGEGAALAANNFIAVYSV